VVGRLDDRVRDPTSAVAAVRPLRQPDDQQDVADSEDIGPLIFLLRGGIPERDGGLRNKILVLHEQVLGALSETKQRRTGGTSPTAVQLASR
jgi:hypothetical protein